MPQIVKPGTADRRPYHRKFVFGDLRLCLKDGRLYTDALSEGREELYRGPIPRPILAQYPELEALHLPEMGGEEAKDYLIAAMTREKMDVYACPLDGCDYIGETKVGLKAHVRQKKDEAHIALWKRASERDAIS